MPVAVMTCRAETDHAARIFRMAVDHFVARLPEFPLIVVDDCSPHPLMLEALATWDAQSFITVIRMGPPVAEGFYKRIGCVSGETCSFGHAPALDRGLWYAYRHLKEPWAFVLDGDVWLLSY